MRYQKYFLKKAPWTYDYFVLSTRYFLQCVKLLLEQVLKQMLVKQREASSVVFKSGNGNGNKNRK